MKYNAHRQATMWHLFLLCTIISASAQYNLETFPKCCAEDQNIRKVIDVNFENATTQSFECLNSSSDENGAYTTSSSVFLSDSVGVRYGMPDGCDLKMIQVDDNVVQLSENNNICYDKLTMEATNGSAKKVIPKTIALLCNETNGTGENIVEIHNIRKCCPPGQMYDTYHHLCRSIEEDFKMNENTEKKWFIEQLKAYTGKIFEFETGLYCKSSEYAVELRHDKFSFSLVGSSLSILKQSNKAEIQSTTGNWCVDREYTSRRLVARVCTQDCTQFDAYCMRKCCPIGQHYKPIRCGNMASACVPTEDDSLYNFSEYVEPVTTKYELGDTLGLRISIRCARGKVVLNKSVVYDRHELSRAGDLISQMGTDKDYCIEQFDVRSCGAELYLTSVVCFREMGPQAKNFKLSFVLNSLSAVCLALTLVVYCSVPRLRNLHGRNLICHVSMMLLAYSCLARVQYQFVGNKTLCAALGYGIYFGFVAAFAWLNVMCVDIWWTFGNIRTVQTIHKGKATCRRFIWYSVYAWGVALALTTTMLLLDQYPVAAALDANMGTKMCWFGSVQNTAEDWPHYIFFVIPMGLGTGVNFVLWVLTARYCSRVKSEVHRMQAGSIGDRAKRRFRIDKANLMLTGKLWIVMGAGWGSELLATLAPEQTWLWTVIDMVNELQGVFIFIILVFKRKIYFIIREKLGLEKPDAQKNGQSSNARTSSTFVSRSISTDERVNARISLPNDNPKQA